MSRFFKSAAFPILIVVVPAFFAQKLISPGTETKKPQFGDFQAQLADGQVSEVGRLDPADADTPIQPSDSTAGYPESESGDPDLRGTGPDAVPPENRRDNDFKSRDRRLGERVDDA